MPVLTLDHAPMLARVAAIHSSAGVNPGGSPAEGVARAAHVGRGNTLVPGKMVDAQGWFRDPGAPKGTNLSENTMAEFSPEEELLFWQSRVDFANEIARRIHTQVRTATPTSSAMEPLKVRIASLLESIRTLKRHAPHDWRNDALILLRAMYDAHLQALYILVNKENADQRAQWFLDFFWVEQHDAAKLIDASDTDIASIVKQSPRRAQHAAVREENYRRVRPTFATKKGDKNRSHWYPGTLADLAGEVGLMSEYNILQRQLSGAVHSGPLALLIAPMFSDRESLVLTAWRLQFRVLGRIAAHHDVELPRILLEEVTDAMKNIFDRPVDTPGESRDQA